MKEYEPKDIEKKWQDAWQESGIYEAKGSGDKTKWYSLMEFPYPSGDGLHTGHVRGFTAMDIVSRKKRMEGFDVMYPIGWDAFGLPTENFAIKTGKDPKVVTKENSDNFRSQFKNLGMSFDWSREINTTDPGYYKWTQWLFLKFLEHGLAYKAKMAINWCPKDKIGLALEEVVDGKCERCGTPVEKREKEQWMLAITKYADRLDKDLETLDYPSRVVAQQRNWIGKSEGAQIKFSLTGILGQEDNKHSVEVFTTRPDTIFGATFLVVSPELANKWVEVGWQASEEVREYIKQALNKTELARQTDDKDKTGVDSGIRAINPATRKEIPVWIADYVLGGYGTGAIMAVPAHDERDFEFANKFNLPVTYVIAPYFLDETENSKPREGFEWKNRDVGVGIVKHWSEERYLMLDWKNGWTGFITGGREEGESMEDSLIRELREETGYKNVRFIKHLGGPNLSDFHAPHKSMNQHVYGYGMYFELVDGEQDVVAKEEYEKHTFVWKSKEEVMPFLRKGSPMGDSRYSEMFWERLLTGNYVYTGDGVLINSGEFNGRNSLEAKDDIVEFVGGEKKSTHKLRDWVFSRQRYWGEPIPVVHCEKCGVVPIPEKDLPVLLPEVSNYQPTDTGESPLANISDWVNTTCPKCGGDAKRETDTMPNWAGSSWYFLRYIDPRNNSAFASVEALKHWMPIDWYNGGMEHTTLHLLYSRFWNKFLFDIGLVPTSEPYKKRTSHGLILAEGGVKMSKSLGNVINPDSIVDMFGADTLRIYEMFMGPFEQAIAWSESALVGPRRFLERVWKLKGAVMEGQEESIDMHKAIKSVSADIETLGFNTAVSSLMIYTNVLEKKEKISKVEYETLLKLLAPFAPHITEEIWHNLGHDSSIHLEEWPQYDESKLEDEEVTLGVQINGKVRASITVSRDENEEEIREKVLQLEDVKKWIDGQNPKKIIVIPGKIVSIVL